MKMSDLSLADMKDERVPNCLYWTEEQVANWIELLGFSFYKECILRNFINGRKLITLSSSTLPDIGVKDFDHIKIITKALREMLNLDDLNWNRSISLPPKHDLGMYLEMKSCTGQRSDSKTYEHFLMDTEDAIWQPPLCNMCSILHH